MIPSQNNHDPHLIQALEQVIDPELRQSIVHLGMVESAVIEQGKANATIKLTIVGCPASERIKADTVSALESVVGGGNADVTLTVMTVEERQALTQKLRPARTSQFGKESLTRVVMVSSGKGGVGKSTITANLAVILAKQGLRVGVVDADVYGFSIPGQLGITATPTRVEDMILPPVAHDVKAISIGMFVGSAKAVSWRGPMLHRTLKQFVTDVFFGDLDVLLLDLPPGTGDVAISAGQLLPTAEVLVVTTPQDAAAEVALRAGIVASQTGQRVLGVIENMSWFEANGERMPLFGSGGGKRVSKELTEELGYTVPLVGQIPVSQRMREAADSGTPVSITDSNDPATIALQDIASKIMKKPTRSLSGFTLPVTPS